MDKFIPFLLYFIIKVRHIRSFFMLFNTYFSKKIILRLRFVKISYSTTNYITFFMF